MHKLLKVLTFMGALLALTFCAVACKTDDDDEPTMYTVTVSSSIEHGKVSVDKSSAEAGAKVKLTATADSGYELDSYSVKDEKSNTITVTEGTFTMPKSNVTVSATFKETAVTPQKTAGNLKTGGAINSILTQLCPGSACTKFARSVTNNASATLYLDTEEKYIPVWSAGTEVYYYVPDGCTPVMNEDSSKMFYGCSKLTSLDVTGFDTSKVTNMSDMFIECSKLTSLDVTGFDTSKVENMSGMFSYCSGLTSLDLTGFDTSKVTNMYEMFSYCSALTTIYATDKFVTTSVTSGNYCFGYCSNLRGGAGTTYDFSRKSADYARIDGGNSAPGYFTLKLGSKSKPDAVGDIVFSDGSATPYTADLTLTEEQKSKAVAVIYYAGTDCSNDSTSRTLGVGLAQNQSGLAWCLNSAKACFVNITTIQESDKDGSDNLEQIEAFDGVDDTLTKANYPAFYFAKNYASQTGSNVSGTDYEDGWYLPAKAELDKIYVNLSTVNKGLAACGGTTFKTDGVYWSSSQFVSVGYEADKLTFGFGVWTTDYKYDATSYVCAVREFN